jgi:cephalosporin hydroxylase
MITSIDETAGTVTVKTDAGETTYPLSSNEGFMAVSRAWLRAGWDAKYVYGFSWFGRPIIQLPDDMVRIQEVIYRIKPDVIIETGIAHGGSLIFYATILKAMEKGKVVGVDIDIRPHNRVAVEAHEMRPLITMIEGSSIAPEIVGKVRAEIPPGATTLILLDSNHTRDHVLEELRLYGPLVSPGSYIVATDGIMAQVTGAPRTKPDWAENNPLAAIEAFVAESPDFVVEEPAFPFNEGAVGERVTYWPRAFIKRLK